MIKFKQYLKESVSIKIQKKGFSNKKFLKVKVNDYDIEIDNIHIKPNTSKQNVPGSKYFTSMIISTNNIGVYFWVDGKNDHVTPLGQQHNPNYPRISNKEAKQIANTVDDFIKKNIDKIK